MTKRANGFLTRWIYLVPITILVIMSAHIALDTRFGFHPDETIHGDGMQYFESHWWPPPLNSDGLLYSPDGWSRVYNGELVYLIYGKVAATLNSLIPKILGTEICDKSIAVPSDDLSPYHVFMPVIFLSKSSVRQYRIYRILNVLLLNITLLSVFVCKPRNVWARILGLTLLCVPQVIYIYSYANSDAWGLSISIFFFLFILTAKIETGSIRYAITSGVLVGLLLLSKETFWLSLSWGSVLAGAKYFEKTKNNASKLSFNQGVIFFAVFAIIVFLIITPLKIIYPATQGNWHTKTEEMREIRSWNAYKPSNPIAAGYRLATKNEPISTIMKNQYWFKTSMMSFYGLFSHMTIVLPNWIYVSALSIALLNIALTISTTWLKWSRLDLMTKVLVVFAPLSIFLNIAASVYNSWTYDFQPQGRYLFSSLIPFAILLAGTVAVENKWSIIFRMVSWLVGYALCLYVLATYAI